MTIETDLEQHLQLGSMWRRNSKPLKTFAPEMTVRLTFIAPVLALVRFQADSQSSESPIWDLRLFMHYFEPIIESPDNKSEGEEK